MFKPKLLSYGLAGLRFTTVDGADSVDFDRFWSGGQILTRETVVLEGSFDFPAEGEVRVVHRFGRQVLAERLVRRECGAFQVNLRLARGHNRIFIDHEDGAFPTFELAVYHRSVLRDWVDNIVKTLILLKIIQTFVAQTFFIPSGSMENTLFPGDYILVEKVSALVSRPHRGDIIIFEFPEDRRKDFVKRLIATAGDWIRVCRGVVYLNGCAVADDDFAVHKNVGEGHARLWRIRACDYDLRRIPEGHYFAMGDNREHSYDSRGWGPLTARRLKGKAFAIYWPYSRMGLIRAVDITKRLQGRKGGP